MKLDDYKLQDIIFTSSYRPLKIRQKCGGANSKFYELIHKILVKNKDINSYFNSGVTKIVYNTTNKNRLLKLVVVKKEQDINKALREPIYMLNNPNICNKPSEITIYTPNKVKNIIPNNNIKIISNDQINLCLITWFEDKAIATGNMILDNKELLSDANAFRNKTRNKIKNDGFCDLSFNNMGFFENSPVFRWIDIRPK